MARFGVPRGGQRTMFFDPWAVLGDPGGPDGPQTAPQGPHDPPKPRFFMILDPFGKGFW